MKKLLLFSGGLDSTALLFLMKPDKALLIDYGQKGFQGELRAAKKLANLAQVSFDVLQAKIDLDIEKIDNEQMTNIPSTEWIPFRNQYILTIGAMYSIKFGYNDIIIGTVKTDEQYKDGQNTFYKILNKLFSFQEGNIFVSFPGIDLTTKQLIQRAALSLDVLGWCHSCTNSYLACGRCPSCIKHQEVMLSLGYNPF